MSATDPARRPGLGNTDLSFGSVAKTLHWLTALLILTAMPLGLIANQWPYDTSETLAVKATLFSIHKTLGLSAFFVALIRILWAMIQPRPRLLTPAGHWQTTAAEVTHWLLYVSLVIVPLSGWLHHAATTGFAPIWWPFGQTLPFVPESEPVAKFFAAWHWLFTKLLGAAILLHIAGALKHHFVDRDATLKRMLPGQPALPADLPEATGNAHRRPILIAGVIWALALAGGTALGLTGDRESAVPQLAEVQSDWVVQEGAVEITVLQLGSAVTGGFSDWTAQISFSETAADGVHGEVTVVIAVPTLSLGGVTTQALDAEFFNADAFPTAEFTGPILANEAGGYVVDGTLTLVGQAVPVTLPFTLEIEGETATATGQVTLDRREFGMGPSYPDEASVGFPVEVSMSLTATRDGG